MLNDKGYVSSATALALLMITMSFLTVAYTVINQNNIRIAQTESSIHEVVNNRTVQERLYGVFSQDVDRSTAIEFDDIDIVYEIDEIERTDYKRTIRLTPNNSAEPLTAEITANEDASINFVVIQVGG